MQSMMSLDIIGGNSVVQQVRLAALLPEGKLIFAVKALDLGGMPVGVPQTSIVTLKNIGVHDATFQVSQPMQSRTGLCKNWALRLAGQELGFETCGLRLEIPTVVLYITTAYEEACLWISNALFRNLA